MPVRSVLRALAVSAALVVFSAAAASAAPAPTTSPSPTPIPEIARVYTSDRSAESARRSIRTTFVVTAATIAREGYRTVADAVETLPGVSLSRYGSFGALTTVSIRGSSTPQVLVLLDGMPIAGSQIDGVDLEQIGTNGVSRIEVVEGGGSTLYGSGSIGGVINIITNAAPSLGASVSSGSFDTQHYAFNTPYVSYSRSYASNAFGLPDGTVRGNSQASFNTIGLHYAHRIGAIEASLTGSLVSNALGAPGAQPFFSPTSEQSNLQRDGRLTLSHASKGSVQTLQIGVSSLDLGFTCNAPVDPNCFNAPSKNPGASLSQDSKTMVGLRDDVGNDDARVVYGVDLTRGNTRVDSGIPYAVDQLPQIATAAYSQVAAYAQAQITAGKDAEVYAGLRGENDGAQGGAYSPSLGALARLGPALELKLNAATAFRAPTAEELYYPGFSNPHLQPERTRVGDATLQAPSLAGGVSLTWFTTAGTNLIVDSPVTFAPENIGHALLQGFTLAVKTRPFHGYTTSLDVTNLYRAEDLETQTRISGRGPAVAATLAFDYVAAPADRFDGIGISATTQGRRGVLDPALPAFDQPVGFTTVNAHVGYRIAPKLVLTLRGYNLGNERYSQIGTWSAPSAPYYAYPMPGRSFALELRT